MPEKYARSQVEFRKLLVGATLIASFACGDPYQHTNPYDPAVPVEISIAGPDTLLSRGQLGQYTAHTTPAFPDSAVNWESSNSFVLEPAGLPGSFEVTFRAPVWPATATVRVSALIGAVDTVGNPRAIGPAPPAVIWRHSGYKDVVVTQEAPSVRPRNSRLNVLPGVMR